MSCARSLAHPAHRGPIVLITIDALRADAVGFLGGDPAATPNLDELARQAIWAQPAVSPSSWTVPAMASIFTGLQPWRHGNWSGERTRLADELETLPERLATFGFTTSGFRSNSWLRAKFGYAQGFDTFVDLNRGGRAEAELRAIDGTPQFVWAHVLEPHAPYVLYPELAARLHGMPENLPPRLRAADLEPFFDPDRPMPPKFEAEARALYTSNVAQADREVGGLLRALRESGHFDDAWIVVTADHGEEFGEGGQSTHGGNLHRVLLEVPLLIKPPRGQERRLAPQPWVSTARIFATLVEAAGGTVSEHHLPSLFRRVATWPLSELYLGNGENAFSLVQDGRQVVWRSRFAPQEPQYFAARRVSLGVSDEMSDEAAAELFAGLNRAFLHVLPLQGLPLLGPELVVNDWRSKLPAAVGDGEVERLARLLRREWQEFNGPEVEPATLTPTAAPELTAADIERLKSLGYVVN